MLGDILDSLRPDSSADVFLGADRITHQEFADLVWTYAGGLRLRQARSMALLGRPGPTTVAMTLAAIGTGTRVDWIDAFAGERLVRARVAAAAPEVAIAEAGLAWPLKGPRWLRRCMGLPPVDIWPRVIPIDHVGAAQQRRFGLESHAPALAVFHRGRTEEPVGVVHSVASLSSGLRAVADMCPGDGPVLTNSLLMMLACLGSGRPIISASRAAGRIPAQIRRRGATLSHLHSWDEVARHEGRLSGTVLVGATAPESTIDYLRASGAERVVRMYALPELFPVAYSDAPDDRLVLADEVEAHIGDDATLRFTGPAMAPRTIEGPYLDEVLSGRRGRLESRTLWLGEETHAGCP